jgi:hypothetical protein
MSAAEETAVAAAVERVLADAPLRARLAGAGRETAAGFTRGRVDRCTRELLA